MATSPTRTSGRRKASAAAGLDCATAFQKIAIGCVATIEAHHSSACAGDAEAVHQIRVAITRLRAAVAFFAPIVIDAEWLRLKKEIVWLNGSLGAARDSDVAKQYARQKRYGAWAQHMIGEALDDSQVRTHRRLARCLRSARTRRLITSMAAWIRKGPWLRRYQPKDVEALPSYCVRELKHWHGRLVRRGRHLKTLGASRRHRLRIKVKRFRYMLEALTETVALWSRGKFHNLHRAAKRLQRTLGEMHDLECLSSLAGGVPQAESGKRASKHPPGYRQRREKLLGAAIAAHRDLKHAGIC